MLIECKWVTWVLDDLDWCMQAAAQRARTSWSRAHSHTDTLSRTSNTQAPLMSTAAHWHYTTLVLGTAPTPAPHLTNQITTKYSRRPTDRTAAALCILIRRLASTYSRKLSSLSVCSRGSVFAVRRRVYIVSHQSPAKRDWEYKSIGQKLVPLCKTK